MGRMFQASIGVATATSQRDIVELVAPAGSSIRVHEIVVTTSVETNANEEQLPMKLSRRVGAFTSGSGGNVETGYALGVTGATEDASTVESGNTTQATGGTEEILSEPYINNRIGWHYLPPPEQRITIAATDALILAMLAIPGTTTAFGGHIIWEEIDA